MRSRSSFFFPLALSLFPNAPSQNQKNTKKNLRDSDSGPQKSLRPSQVAQVERQERGDGPVGEAEREREAQKDRSLFVGEEVDEAAAAEVRKVIAANRGKKA